MLPAKASWPNRGPGASQVAPTGIIEEVTAGGHSLSGDTTPVRWGCGAWGSILREFDPGPAPIQSGPLSVRARTFRLVERSLVAASVGGSQT